MFSLQDLNTAVNHEPRISHKRLAEALGYPLSHKLLDMIERHRVALIRFGDIPSTVAENTDTKGRGRPGKILWLSKRQVLYICSKSDMPNAIDVTIEMVEVFDEYLAGTLKPIHVREHSRRPPSPAARMLHSFKIGFTSDPGVLHIEANVPAQVASEFMTAFAEHQRIAVVALQAQQG